VFAVNNFDRPVCRMRNEHVARWSVDVAVVESACGPVRWKLHTAQEPKGHPSFATCFWHQA
jgi:hypothetical protein